MLVAFLSNSLRFTQSTVLQVLMYGEALHDYEVSLSEGVYTVAVGIMADDPKQVIFKFARVLWFEF